MTEPKVTAASAAQRPLTRAVAELFPRQGDWTEEDYWPIAQRNRLVELSDGKLIVPPMPTTEHQDVVGNIYMALRTYVRANRIGRVSIAPLPVRLWPEKIREPDVIVMLNAHLERIQNQFWGPPDLVVEVLSSGTEQTDRKKKIHEYAAAGVIEYWIVAIESQSVELYGLENNTFVLDAEYSLTDHIASRVLAGFILPVTEVFSES